MMTYNEISIGALGIGSRFKLEKRSTQTWNIIERNEGSKYTLCRSDPRKGIRLVINEKNYPNTRRVFIEKKETDD